MATKISIIGAGRVGTALGVALSRKGYKIATASRSFSSAQNLAQSARGQAYKELSQAALKGDIIFITTPDSQIASVARGLVEEGGIKRGVVVFHVSGDHSSIILSPCKEAGAYIGSLHPLQSFADREEAANNFPGSFFALEGDPEAVSCGEKIVSALEGRLLRITPEVKALYHAGACAASNYLVAVVDLGVKLFKAAGIEEKFGLGALLPLIHGTIRNLERVGLPNALTGPISRGDISTVQEHLEAMAKYSPELIDLYSELGKHTIGVGLAKGTIGPEEEIEIKKALGNV